MKDKEKQIEEMAKVISKAKEDMWLQGARDYKNHSRGIAEALLPLIKQYQEQAVKEFAEKLHKKAIMSYITIDNNTYGALSVSVGVIDETLKEGIGEKE